MKRSSTGKPAESAQTPAAPASKSPRSSSSASKPKPAEQTTRPETAPETGPEAGAETGPDTGPDTGRPRSDAEAVQAISELLGGGSDALQPGEPGGREEQDPLEDPPGAGPEQGPVGPDGAGAEDSPADGETPPQAAPKTLSEAAERLGMTEAELYGLEISTGDSAAGDGETLTLGALKDAYGERSSWARETAEREARLDERETALQQEQSLWAELGDGVRQVLRPEQQERLRQHLVDQEAAERRKLIAMAPELGDDAKWGKLQTDLQAFFARHGLKGLGLSRAEHVLAARKFMRMEERLERLQKFQPKATPPEPVRPSPKPRPNAKARAARARGGSEADKLSAVSDLLRGG